jgi:hypothetical protein
MSAKLYATKDEGQFHTYSSHEATKTLNMISLDGYRFDLSTHNEIAAAIEPAVQLFTLRQLEGMNAE